MNLYLQDLNAGEALQRGDRKGSFETHERVEGISKQSKTHS